MNTAEEFNAAFAAIAKKAATDPLPLPKDTRIMSDDEWVTNKSCELKKRNHKWQWKHDTATNLPHEKLAQCVYCGIETELTRQGYGAA